MVLDDPSTKGLTTVGSQSLTVKKLTLGPSKSSLHTQTEMLYLNSILNDGI